jgi:adenylate cyclase
MARIHAESKSLIHWQRRWFSALMLAACIAGAAGLFYPPFLATLLKAEHWTADWRTALLSDRVDAVRPDIAVVVFNSETLAGRPSLLTVPRDLHGEVIRAIDKAHPRAIGLDFYFVHPTDPDKDRAFLDALRTATAPIVVGAANESADQFNETQLSYQRTFTSETERQTGYINLHHDRDDIVRFTASPVAGTAYPESLAVRLAQVGSTSSHDRPTSQQTRRIAWLWGPDHNPYPFVTIPAQHLLPPNPKAEENLRMLTGKIVLTGIDLPYVDHHRTPLSVWTGQPMIGAMVHAQILAQLLDKRSLTDLAAAGDELFLGAVGLIGLALGWLLWQRRANFLGLGAATAVLVAMDAALFAWLHMVLPLTLGLYVWFTAVTAGHHLRKLVLG